MNTPRTNLTALIFHLLVLSLICFGCSDDPEPADPPVVLDAVLEILAMSTEEHT
jgi:hypothetical protein